MENLTTQADLMTVETVSYRDGLPSYDGTIARPRVVIPVFPGNNCEYDSAARVRSRPVPW